MIGFWRQDLAERLRAELLPLTIVCLLTVLFFSPRIFGRSFSAVGQHMYYTYPWAGVTAANPGVSMRGHTQTDHAETYYPLTVFATDAWRSGEIPMWMPYGFGGFPIMELGMTSLLYPPRLLLLLLFDPIRQHELMMFLHLLMAAVGMYALMRSWGANPAGSVLAAVVWQFNGHNTFWLVIEQMAIVAAWCPWMLLAATLAVRRKSYKWAVVVGICTSMALYSGGTHYTHLSGWLLAAWYGTATLREAFNAFRNRRRREMVGYLALPVVSLLTTVIVGMAYWLPLLRALSDVSRSPVPLEQQLAQGSSWPVILRMLWLPRSAMEVAGFPDSISFLFTGLIPLVLALAGVLLSRSIHVRLALLFAVMAILFVLGVPWWVGLLHKYLPFFNTMNLYVAPYVYCFAIAVLAGFGLSELAERWKQSGFVRRFIVPAFAALIVVVGVFQTGALLRAYKRVFQVSLLDAAATLLSWRTMLLLLIVAVIFWLAAAVVMRGLRWPRGKDLSRLPWPSYAAIFVVAVNLFLFAWLTIPYQWASPTWFYPETPLITALRQSEGERRIIPVYHNTTTWVPPVFPGKTAAIFRLHSGNGYESLLPFRTALLWRAVEAGDDAASTMKQSMPRSYRPYFMHDRLPISLLEKLSVGLLVTPQRVEPRDVQSGNSFVADGTLRPIYQGADGIVYENPRALPRAFLVSQIRQVADSEQALQTLLKPDFDARLAAITETALSQQESSLLRANGPLAASAGLARIVRESLNQVEVETSSQSGQSGRMLVLNDSWAESWRARVDGVEQPVHRVNFNSRGVVLPAGNHRIVFQYRPVLLLAGLWVSGVTLAVLLFWLLVWPLLRIIRMKPVLVGQVLNLPSTNTARNGKAGWEPALPFLCQYKIYCLGVACGFAPCGA